MAVFCRCGILRQTPARAVHPAPDSGTPNAPTRGHHTPQHTPPTHAPTRGHDTLPGTRPTGASGTPAHARNGDTVAHDSGDTLRPPVALYSVPVSCDAGTVCT